MYFMAGTIEETSASKAETHHAGLTFQESVQDSVTEVPPLLLDSSGHRTT